MKPENKFNYDSEPELTEEDLAAIKRSEEEFERGDYLELDDAIELFKKKYPGIKI